MTHINKPIFAINSNSHPNELLIQSRTNCTSCFTYFKYNQLKQSGGRENVNLRCWI